MTQLVLLVVAAAWLAVLIPPMLRSRVENRPNSSVTDFRRQLTRLQNTATPQRGAVRSMGRPLAQSPLSRPVASGRPVQPTLRSGVTRHQTPSEIASERAAASTATMPAQERPADVTSDAPRFRSHGDSSSGQRRPATRQPMPQQPVRQNDRFNDGQSDALRRPPQVHEERYDESPATRSDGRRAHGDPTGGQRRPGATEVRTPAKQRRMNIMFVLVISTACTLFLSATTSSNVLLYAFVLSFISLCAYIYMLAQVRQREDHGYSDGWMDSY
ncbi:MAG: hypothetical protein ACJAXA_000656 [Candidatus Aldehydirespiratoraceae bacterium]|jgi:hypothetical protein